MKSDYWTVRHLFSPLEAFQPMCTAVLEGIWPGNVWGDEVEKPQTAVLVSFLSTGGPAWCFLAGEPGNRDFNMAVNEALFSDRVAGKEVGAFLFTGIPEDWDGNLKLIGDPRQPVPMKRHHYVCHEISYDWQANLPVGFSIQPMKVGLLQQTDIKLPSMVKTTLGKWRSIHDERFQDFGFIVVHKQQAVAWATVDFVSSGSGDLGFETLSEYQKRGLGSAVAAAALEHGLEKGIHTHWTCAADNVPSQRTAQKLGLSLERDYTMYLFAMDITEHLAQLAYSYLARQEYQRAIECYEELFTQKAEVPVWAYFDTAQAWAALGEGEHALKYLRLAAKEGWSAVEMTEQVPEFQALHDSHQWKEVIEHMQRNQDKSTQG